MLACRTPPHGSTEGSTTELLYNTRDVAAATVFMRTVGVVGGSVFVGAVVAAAAAAAAAAFLPGAAPYPNPGSDQQDLRDTVNSDAAPGSWHALTSATTAGEAAETVVAAEEAAVAGEAAGDEDEAEEEEAAGEAAGVVMVAAAAVHTRDGGAAGSGHARAVSFGRDAYEWDFIYGRHVGHSFCNISSRSDN